MHPIFIDSQKEINEDVIVPTGHQLKELFITELPNVKEAMKTFLRDINRKINIIIDGWQDSSSHHYFGNYF